MGTFYHQTILDNLGFVLLKRFDTYMVTKYVRLIVHRLSSKNSARMQVVPFIKAIELVVPRLESLLNLTITELLTIVLLPSVRERPMAFIRDFCIVDASLAVSSHTEHIMLVVQCLVQQYMIRGFTARDQWAQRLLRGIRDYYALIFKSIGESDCVDVMDVISQRALQLDEEQQLAMKTNFRGLIDADNLKGGM